MDDVLNSDVAQTGGWMTFVGAALANIIEWLGKIPVNDYMQVLLSIGGVLFIFYKIYTQKIIAKNEKLDTKIKEEQLKQLLKDNESGGEDEQSE
jgi:hypothetical protein